MYQFSRAIYRDLAPHITGEAASSRLDAHASVLRACEATVERLATDRHYFKRPARTLFNDIRIYFPMREQARVCMTVTRYLALAEHWLERQPQHGYDVNGNPLQCRTTPPRPPPPPPPRPGRRGGGPGPPGRTAPAKGPPPPPPPPPPRGGKRGP